MPVELASEGLGRGNRQRSGRGFSKDCIDAIRVVVIGLLGNEKEQIKTFRTEDDGE